MKSVVDFNFSKLISVPFCQSVYFAHDIAILFLASQRIQAYLRQFWHIYTVLDVVFDEFKNMKGNLYIFWNYGEICKEGRDESENKIEVTALEDSTLQTC